MPKAPSLPIQKLPNGRWQLTIPSSYTGTGKRRRPSFDSKREAESYKARVIRGQDVLRQHSTVDQADLSDVARAKKHFLQIGQDWVGVQRLAEFWTLHHSGDTKTLGEVFKAHWQDKAQHRRPDYQSDIRNLTTKMKTALGEEYNLSEITGEMIVEAINSFWTSTTNAQYNKARRTLRPIWSYARARGWIGQDVFERVPTREHVTASPTCYTLAEVRALLAHTIPENSAYWVLGMFAGVRPFELHRLQWEDINLDESRLIIRREVSKTKKPRKVELEPNVVAMLRPVDGIPIVPEVNARKIVEAPRKAAKPATTGNSLARHTYASMHLAQFNDLARLQANAGHETPKVTLTNYYDLIPKEDAEAFWRIGEGDTPG